MTGFLTITGVWIAALLTLVIFSFLFKDNPFYKFAEHLVVGLSAGYWCVILVQTVLVDLMVLPLWKDITTGRIFIFTAEAAERTGTNGLVLDLIPIVLGAMMWLRFFPKTEAYARIPIAFVLGSGAGLAIPTALDTFVIEPLAATLSLPVVPTSWQTWVAGVFGAAAPQASPRLSIWAALGNLLILAGVFGGVVYFFFSKEHKGVTGWTANFGIWILMIGFGSTFGFTVMSRVSLLLGRFEFLINRWLIENLWRLIFPAGPPPA